MMRLGRWFIALSALLVVAPLDVGAQRLTYNSGQAIAPAYEGWEKNEDGSYNLMFGYMNLNWQDEPNIPVGANNAFSPGPADRGQPTHFLPRRNRFVFKVRVPADFGEQELVWTLTANGQTVRAYGSLKRDYVFEKMTIISEKGGIGGGAYRPEVLKNVPPTVRVEGPPQRTAKVGEPMPIILQVVDDGLPPVRRQNNGRRDGSERRVGAAAAPQPEEVVDPARRPPQRSLVDSATGLRVSVYHYRGDGKVDFDPPQIKQWEDTRTGANSPHAPNWQAPPLPPDGRIMVRATFSKPGTYVLRALADDGGLWDDEDVTVTVSK